MELKQSTDDFSDDEAAAVLRDVSVAPQESNVCPPMFMLRRMTILHLRLAWAVPATLLEADPNGGSLTSMRSESHLKLSIAICWHCLCPFSHQQVHEAIVRREEEAKHGR